MTWADVYDFDRYRIENVGDGYLVYGETALGILGPVSISSLHEVGLAAGKLGSELQEFTTDMDEDGRGSGIMKIPEPQFKYGDRVVCDELDGVGTIADAIWDSEGYYYRIIEHPAMPKACHTLSCSEHLLTLATPPAPPAKEYKYEIGEWVIVPGDIPGEITERQMVMQSGGIVVTYRVSFFGWRSPYPAISYNEAQIWPIAKGEQR